MLKQFPPPQRNGPGHKFFASAILIGIFILIGIWLFDKSATPKKTVVPKTNSAAVRTPPDPVKTEVRVLTKTNLTGAPLSNGVAVLTAQTQSLTAPVLAQTNAAPTNTAPVAPGGNGFFPRSAQTVFEAQLALAREGISPGSIDGVIGSQTRAALRAFQQRENLPASGELDPATKAKLLLFSEPYGQWVVNANELATLQPLGTNWWSKAQQTHLAYETILELVAEKSCCSPAFLKQLNPSVNWAAVTAGTSLRVPIFEKPKANATAASVLISLSEKNLKVYDAEKKLIAHFPCSIAQRVEKRPIGELQVEKIATDPDYTFNPEIFPESAEARSLKTKLIISPGPNNPVGTVWIGLNKPGYGIHGSPKPEEVGRTESHGCFRLANWNAEFLVRLVSIGTPILIEP